MIIHPATGLNVKVESKRERERSTELSDRVTFGCRRRVGVSKPGEEEERGRR